MTITTEREASSALVHQVGDLVRRLRVGRELSLPKAAALCGDLFSAGSLGAWERGSRPITIGTLDAILAAYGVSTSWFMGEAVLRARGTTTAQA
jgi:transcriptional regulator with XRE-family HTH domain